MSKIPYVNVPNDLSKVKTKLAFNLTKRQLVCFGVAAAVGVPSYLLARSSIGNTGAMFFMMAVALPAFLRWKRWCETSSGPVSCGLG